MEFLADILTGLAPYLHYLAFFLLVLSGLSLPVSEDLVFLLSAAIGATHGRHNLPVVYCFGLAGALTGDLAAYSIGRHAGRKLLNTRFFRSIISEKKIETMEGYFARYGSKTILIGRLIPFGARNIIFLTAGFCRMRVSRFMMSDIVPLLCTSGALFYLGARFGENYTRIIPYLERYRLSIFALFAVILIIFVVRLMRRKKSPLLSENQHD